MLRPNPITLTAAGVYDPDGVVEWVEFWRDEVEGSGTLLGVGVEDNGDWTLTLSTAGWALGEHTFFARAQDNDGAWSEPVGTTVLVQQPPQPHRPATIGVWRDGVFYLDADGDGRWDATADRSFAFGRPGDTPLVGDFSGDGYNQLGVWREGTFYLDYNGTGAWDAGVRSFRFGNATDTPIIGDWNGDGTDQIGVWRDGLFYLDYNGNGRWDSGADKIFRFGNTTDTPIVGDWNGDGIDHVGVWRSGTFYLDYDGNGIWNSGVDKVYRFGNTTDTPIIGAWAGSDQPAPLYAASAPPAGHPAPEPLTLDALQPIVEEAVLRLPADLEGLSFQVVIADLPGLRLGQALGDTIWIDANAAGFGWFIDPTPADNNPFRTTDRPDELEAQPGSDAALRMDLLTVVMHELSHLRGRGHEDDGLMQTALEPGTRWLDDLAAAKHGEDSDRELQVQAIDEALKFYWV